VILLESTSLRAYGAILAVALLAFWLGLNRTLDRTPGAASPAPGVRTHAAAQRL
jgi:hypothetical protein